MSKKFEDKILKELIERLIQKDREIKNKYEEESIRNATKEVLIEMTDLSVSEINDIEKDIRKSMLRKQPKSYFIYILLSLLFIVSAVFMFKYFYSDRYKDELVFEENFVNNDNTWNLFDNYIYNMFFTDGKYMFMTDQKDQAFIEKLKIKIPSSFTLELTSTLIGGKYGKYGLSMNLGSTFENTFYLHPDNKTYIGLMNNDTKEPWISFPVLNENSSGTCVQKITANPVSGKYKYYVNNKLIGEGQYKNYSNQAIGLIVNGSRKVSYDHIKLINDKTGELIIDGSLEELKNKPKSKAEFNVMSSIADGQYIFKSNKKEECFSASIPFKLKKNSKIKLKSTKLSGENYYYGLILENDKGKYYSFELKSTGLARFIKYSDENNELLIDNLKTAYYTKENISVEQTIILAGDKIEYYVNDNLVYTENSNRIDIDNIGLRVCGNLSVTFEKLEVWE